MANSRSLMQAQATAQRALHDCSALVHRLSNRLDSFLAIAFAACKELKLGRTPAIFTTHLTPPAATMNMASAPATLPARAVSTCANRPRV